MFCSKRNDMYRSSKDIDRLNIQGSNYLSNLSSCVYMEEKIQTLIQQSFESEKKLSHDDIEELTKKIIKEIHPFTTDYLLKLFIQKDLYTNRLTEPVTVIEVDNEKEDEEKLEVFVVDGKNPCHNCFYDSSKVEFEFTNKNLGLIAVKKGTCFRCSSYKNILYSNVENSSSQICERCITEMFEDVKK